MAVPLTSDVFERYGKTVKKLDYAVPPRIALGKPTCCLHGANCPYLSEGVTALKGSQVDDHINGPAELRKRVDAYLSSGSGGKDERHVYESINVLLSTLLFHEDLQNADKKAEERKSAIHPSPASPKSSQNMGGRRKSISDDLIQPAHAKRVQPKSMRPKIFIHPSSPGRLAWDLMSLFIVLIDSVILPFQLSYYESAPDDTWFWMGTVFFTCDICLNFLTGYVAGPLEVDHGQLVTEKSRIARTYLKSWFIIDFISTMPWQELIPSGGGSGTRAAKAIKIAKLVRFLRLARMLKLLKLQDLWTKIENVVGSMFVVQALQLLRVLFLVIYVCHWNACIWWVIGNPMALLGDAESGAVTLEPHWTTRLYYQTFRNDEGEELIYKFRWIDKDIPVRDKYAFCFYWTLGVMRTMPQEAFPVNALERIYTLIFMFFAFSMFSICITKITQMFNKINLRRQEFNEHMAHVRSYMHENDVEAELRDRICGYLEHRFTRRRIFAKELGLFNELSESLRIEIRSVQLAPAIGSIWLFEALTEQEVKKIVTICSIQDFAPGDIITQQDTISTGSFILVSGRMSMLDPATLRGLAPGEANEKLRHSVSVVACDVESLLLDQPAVSERSVWALDFSEVLVIYKVDFLDLRKMNPSIDLHIRMLQQSVRGVAIRDKTNRRMAIRGLYGKLGKQALKISDAPVHVSGPSIRTRRNSQQIVFHNQEDDMNNEGAGAAVMSG